MADAAVENKEVAPVEVSSTEAAKESPVKPSPVKKAHENGNGNGKEENGKEENGTEEHSDETPAENGGVIDDESNDASNDAVENGDATEKAAVKRKSVVDSEVTENSTPDKKAKVADEAPAPEAEEAVA